MRRLARERPGPSRAGDGLHLLAAHLGSPPPSRAPTRAAPWDSLGTAPRQFLLAIGERRPQLSHRASPALGVRARRRLLRRPPATSTWRAQARPARSSPAQRQQFLSLRSQRSEAVVQLVADRRSSRCLRCSDAAVHIDLGRLEGNERSRDIGITGIEASSSSVSPSSPSAAASATASSIICGQLEPTAATWPDCSSPSRSPAPRMSRSRIAILKPEPSSVWSSRVDWRRPLPPSGHRRRDTAGRRRHARERRWTWPRIW